MPPFNIDKYHRQSLRRGDHNYAGAGYYFITIRAHDNQPHFGTLAEDGLHVSEAGKMLLQEWTALGKRFPVIVPDIFVVMPDHVHGVLMLIREGLTQGNLGHGEENIRQRRDSHPTASTNAPDELVVESPSISRVLQAYKSLTTKRYCEGVRQQNWPGFNGRLWQRNYNDRIIRSRQELDAIRHYIRENPRRLYEKIYVNENANADLQ